MSVKISELPSATSLTGTEEIPIVQTGTTKKATTELLQQNQNYSTNEQRVGTWIDGKPLYIKCFELTNLPTANNYTDISIDFTMSDIFPVKLETTLKSDWGAYFTTFVGSNNSYVSSSLAVNNSQTNPIQIRIRSSIDIHTYVGYAILSYTKTTDSAS